MYRPTSMHTCSFCNALRAGDFAGAWQQIAALSKSERPRERALGYLYQSKLEEWSSPANLPVAAIRVRDGLALLTVVPASSAGAELSMLLYLQGVTVAWRCMTPREATRLLAMARGTYRRFRHVPAVRYWWPHILFQAGQIALYLERAHERALSCYLEALQVMATFAAGTYSAEFQAAVCGSLARLEGQVDGSPRARRPAARRMGGRTGRPRHLAGQRTPAACFTTLMAHGPVSGGR